MNGKLEPLGPKEEELEEDYSEEEQEEEDYWDYDGA